MVNLPSNSRRKFLKLMAVGAAASTVSPLAKQTQAVTLVNLFGELLEMTKQKFLLFIVSFTLTLIVGMSQIGYTTQSSLIVQAQPPNTLFENVQIFDGTSEQLSDTVNVLVVDNKIEKISPRTISAPQGKPLTRINGNGRTLMPGLSDAHWHFNFAITNPAATLSPKITDEEAETVIRSNSKTVAQDMLMRGFTSARDPGGNIFWLKKAIDSGELIGPRIWPSGAMISQTSGHFDFSSADNIPKTDSTPLPRTENLGITKVADGVPEVLLRVREQLKQGASQIKLATGGGVSSDFDPIDVTQ